MALTSLERSLLVQNGRMSGQKELLEYLLRHYEAGEYQSPEDVLKDAAEYGNSIMKSARYAAERMQELLNGRN